MTYQPEWRAEDEARVVRIEELYARDKRDELPKGHPLRCTYTGLADKYRAQADA